MSNELSLQRRHPASEVTDWSFMLKFASWAGHQHSAQLATYVPSLCGSQECEEVFLAPCACGSVTVSLVVCRWFCIRKEHSSRYAYSTRKRKCLQISENFPEECTVLQRWHIQRMLCDGWDSSVFCFLLDCSKQWLMRQTGYVPNKSVLIHFHSRSA